jgi:hypothetical protein
MSIVCCALRRTTEALHSRFFGGRQVENIRIHCSFVLEANLNFSYSYSYSFILCFRVPCISQVAEGALAHSHTRTLTRSHRYCVISTTSTTTTTTTTTMTTTTAAAPTTPVISSRFRAPITQRISSWRASISRKSLYRIFRPWFVASGYFPVLAGILFLPVTTLICICNLKHVTTHQFRGIKTQHDQHPAQIHSQIPAHNRTLHPVRIHIQIPRVPVSCYWTPRS